MKEYEAPVIEVVEFTTEDVLNESNFMQGDENFGGSEGDD